MASGSLLSLIARLARAASYSFALLESPSLPRSSHSVAAPIIAGCGRNEVGCRDKVFCYFAEQWDHDRPCRQFNSCCFLGGNYPPARHHEGTHTPIKYALHSRFVPSDVAMSTHGTSKTTVGGVGEANVANTLTVICMYGKPWTMRVQCGRRNGDTIYPSGDNPFVSASISENGARCIPRYSFL